MVALVSAYPGAEDGSMAGPVNGGADEKQQCVFTSRNYAVGDVWYSRLGQRGALQCVACLCQEVCIYIYCVILNGSVYNENDFLGRED